MAPVLMSSRQIESDVLLGLIPRDRLQNIKQLELPLIDLKTFKIKAST